MKLDLRDLIAENKQLKKELEEAKEKIEHYKSLNRILMLDKAS